MDTWIFQHVNGLAGHFAWLDGGMVAVTHYGPYVLMAAFLALWFWPGPAERRRTRQIGAIVTAVGVLMALGGNQVIVHLWSRERPFVDHAAYLLVPRSTDPSFPSDHATFAFAAALGLLLIRRRLGVLALAFAALIAFSRVYIGAHYFTDVVAGAVVGCAFVLLAHSQRKRIARIVDPVLRWLQRVRLA